MRPTKLRNQTRVAESARLHLRLAPTSAAQVAHIRERYGELLGRDISNAAIIRRAVEILEDALTGINSQAAAAAEAHAVLRGCVL